MQMRRGFGVDRHAARAGGGEVVEVVLRLDDHEMHVERQRTCTRRTVSMTFAPKVRFGTKRPSITSM